MTTNGEKTGHLKAKVRGHQHHWCIYRYWVTTEQSGGETERPFCSEVIPGVTNSLTSPRSWNVLFQQTNIWTVSLCSVSPQHKAEKLERKPARIYSDTKTQCGFQASDWWRCCGVTGGQVWVSAWIFPLVPFSFHLGSMGKGLCLSTCGYDVCFSPEEDEISCWACNLHQVCISLWAWTQGSAARSNYGSIMSCVHVCLHWNWTTPPPPGHTLRIG